MDVDTGSGGGLAASSAGRKRPAVDGSSRWPQSKPGEAALKPGTFTVPLFERVVRRDGRRRMRAFVPSGRASSGACLTGRRPRRGDCAPSAKAAGEQAGRPQDVPELASMVMSARPHLAAGSGLHAVLIGRSEYTIGQTGALGELCRRAEWEIGAPCGAVVSKLGQRCGRSPSPRRVVPRGRRGTVVVLPALRAGHGQVLHHAAVTGRDQSRHARGRPRSAGRVLRV